MSKPIELSDSTFEDEVLEADTPILVDFWADWCGPCKMIAPVVEELAGEFDGRVRVGKLDVDANPNAMNAYQVASIPTLILFKDGEPVERIVGVTSKQKLAQAMEKHS
jgi:thioredoxin 1